MKLNENDIIKKYNAITNPTMEDGIVNYKIYNSIYVPKSKENASNALERNEYAEDDCKILYGIFTNKIRKSINTTDFDKDKIVKYKNTLNGSGRWTAGSHWWQKSNFNFENAVVGIIVNQFDMLSKLINAHNRRMPKIDKKDIQKTQKEIIERIQNSYDHSIQNTGIKIEKEQIIQIMKNPKNINNSDKYTQCYQNFLIYILTYKFLKTKWKDKVNDNNIDVAIGEEWIRSEYEQISVWVKG